MSVILDELVNRVGNRFGATVGIFSPVGHVGCVEGPKILIGNITWFDVWAIGNLWKPLKSMGVCGAPQGIDLPEQFEAAGVGKYF
jgi:hypothetical protein